MSHLGRELIYVLVEAISEGEVGDALREPVHRVIVSVFKGEMSERGGEGLQVVHEGMALGLEVFVNVDAGGLVMFESLIFFCDIKSYLVADAGEEVSVAFLVQE